MADTPRRPLPYLSAAERTARLRAEGKGADGWPLNSTPLEKEAQRNADKPPFIPLTKAERQEALTAALKAGMEKSMETKPGVKTSEFWLNLLAGLGIALLAFTLDHGLPAIAEQLPSMGVVGSVLLVLVPVVKMGLGWLLQRLSSKYAESRAEVKTAALQAAGDAQKAA